MPYRFHSQCIPALYLYMANVCNEWVTVNVALISVVVWSCACLLDVIVRMHGHFAASCRWIFMSLYINMSIVCLLINESFCTYYVYSLKHKLRQLLKPRKLKATVAYCRFSTIKCQYHVADVAYPPHFEDGAERERQQILNSPFSGVRLSLVPHKTEEQWVKIYWCNGVVIM